MLYRIRGAPAAKFLLKNLGNHKNTTMKDISEAVTFVVLCHDAKFLCQIYVVCVLGSKISCLQYLVEGSNTKKWDRYIFKCFTVNRTFIWDVWLTTSGETACYFRIRFSWHTCFPNTIFLFLWSLFKIKYVFLIVFISIWQMDSRNSFMNLPGRSHSFIAKMVGNVFFIESVLPSTAFEVSLNKTFSEVYWRCTPTRSGKWKIVRAECFFCSCSRFSIPRRPLPPSSFPHVSPSVLPSFLPRSLSGHWSPLVPLKRPP